MSFDVSDWLTWVSLGIGLVVTGLVFWVSGRVSARRKQPPIPSEEDLPWDDLLEALKAQQQRYGGELSDTWNRLSSSELLKRLLHELPRAGPGANRTSTLQEDFSLLPSGRQRRSSPRRWHNPTEVRLTSPMHTTPQKALVFNRSIGGLALVTDSEQKIDSILFVKAVEAPSSVPVVKVSVRHARQAGKLWVIGCEYLQEIPWNVKVWFG